MAVHVFRELEFHKELCNPCSKICEFSIIEAKLRTEEKMRPINTYE
jgi:hypothetical protein